LTSTDGLFNPYPGLRPFEPDEDHLFFGREPEIDELLRRLRFNRFLSVVGTSGCGKSSLIRCGLISSLHSGMMVRAGSSWRVSIFRPGEDPIGHLAAALDSPDVIGTTDDMASTNRVLVEASLRRGPRGLVDAVRHARIPTEDNLLVVVDQFEELFRFQRSRQAEDSRDDAVSFVKLLLEAASQNEVPIYVVITMRADFIDDCMEYPGLPEALNAGQYLVPRMTRDALRTVITGPAAVAGGQIAPRLVRRLLNDLGTDQDQLPVLQHALMRTWEHWSGRRKPADPVDLEDYEAVGTLHRALSLHAEEAYEETGGDRGKRIAEVIFKALTDTVTDPRGTRRPCSIAELTTIANVPQAEVIRVVETFRRPGRSFLMPPSEIPLHAPSIVDISHESLMRCWTRLIGWADHERLSATVYLRVSKAAAWYEEGSAGLWRDPELELGLKWRRENPPNAAWARRYAEPFERAMHFLDRSEEERDREAAERRAEKRKQWRQLQWTAAMLAVLLLIAGTMAAVAFREGGRARAENARAEENLRLARAAVDESLAVAEREPSRLAADFPELIRFRQQLLDQAQRFYREFVNQAPTDLGLRSELAFANLRLAHIDRALGSRERAATGYREAINQFEGLVRDADRPEYRQALGNAYNWLGETERMSGTQFDAARSAYDRALALQDGLVTQASDNVEYRRDLARTRYNRGILFFEHVGREAGAFTRAEDDFRAAIELLEPLARDTNNSAAAQELGRAYNNVGTLLASNTDRAAEARAPYTRAVEIHEALVAREPDNREYSLELVKFYNNLAELLRESGETRLADARNSQAITLVEELSRPAPSLSIERADSHNLRGRILQTSDPGEALAEYRRAFEIYQVISAGEQTTRLPEFHLRMGDLMVNLALWVGERPGSSVWQALLSDVMTFYLTVAQRSASSGTPGEASSVLDTLATVLPLLPDATRRSVDAVVREIEPRLRTVAAAQS
jgi:tetratricopeptide (TPR) repeat protein